MAKNAKARRTQERESAQNALAMLQYVIRRLDAKGMTEVATALRFAMGDADAPLSTEWTESAFRARNYILGIPAFFVVITVGNEGSTDGQAGCGT